MLLTFSVKHIGTFVKVPAIFLLNKKYLLTCRAAQEAIQEPQKGESGEEHLLLLQPLRK
jgi:hypothetical protein